MGLPQQLDICFFPGQSHENQDDVNGMTGGTPGIPTSETSKNPSVDCSEPGYAALSDDGRRNALNGHLKRWLPSGAGAPGCPSVALESWPWWGKKEEKDG